MDAVTMPVDMTVAADARPIPAVDTSRVTDLAALELALDRGLLREWNQVVADDPFSSVYQSPGWCVPWYRNYQDAYEPHLVIVRSAGAVVGIVPMAVEKASGALVFASEAMADYRDIVARRGYRDAVVAALIQDYLAGGFQGPLRIGWIDPASDTPALAAAASSRLGLHHTIRYQPCWRWFPVEGENLQKKFSRVRTHLNHFKRQGDVVFDVITSPREWARFAGEFYRQHSLRQLQASREVSFDDPRKQRLYAALFEAGDVRLHVTACRVKGRMISGHIGLIWRDVLLLGAPSINLEDENRSPALILMAWIIQNAAELGLAGFDLTIGESEFKRRLGNRCVELAMVEIYGRARDYYTERVRDEAVKRAKDVVEVVLGDDAWKTRVKPAVAAAAHKWRRAAELGPRAAIVRAASTVLGGQVPEMAYTLTPGMLHQPVGDALPAEHHENHVEDLLRWSGPSAGANAAINGCARSYSRNRAAGHTLHTLLVGARLAAWCYGDAETIYDVFALPGADARACETLIRTVLRGQFASGAERVRAVVSEDARRLRTTLAKMGFQIAGAA